MMPDNKYYTPTIEEFHVGFEYEIFEDFDVPGKDKEWHKQVYGKNGANPENIDHVSPLMGKMDKFRVKYLDKEDIESLGWQITSSDTGLMASTGISRFQFTSTKMPLGFNKSYTYVLTVLGYPTLISITNEGYQLFSGTIKNKSELRQIMKMVGI